jgi:hypothetical protein
MSGILILIFGMVGVTLPFLFTPTFVINYFSPDHDLQLNTLQLLNSIRYISFVTGIYLILSGSVLITFKNLGPTLQRIYAFFYGRILEEKRFKIIKLALLCLNREGSKIKKLLFIIFSVLCYSLILMNFYWLSRDMIYGDSSGQAVFPQPLIEFMRVPDSVIAIEHNAVNRIAADYAQIYFPSQELSNLTRNYETGYLDPWARPSRYAPLIHYICSILFCKLGYGYASFIHMLTQMVLFYFFFIIAFKALGIETNLWSGLLLVNIFLFATPAGLGWFERGQFSLYIALSYLLLILGFLKNKPAFVIASAMFAYVKWTSFPFLFVVFAVYLLSSSNMKEGLKNTRLALIYLLIILSLSLLFRSSFIHFLEGLYIQEANTTPAGISLVWVLPRSIVKGLPFFLIVLGYLALQRNNKTFSYLIPYLVGSGILLLNYPTKSYEYNIPNLFCFIPLIFYWTKKSDLISKMIRYSFFLFIILMSFSYYISLFKNIYIILSIYVVVSMFFILPTLIRPRWFSSLY